MKKLLLASVIMIASLSVCAEGIVLILFEAHRARIDALQLYGEAASSLEDGGFGSGVTIQLQEMSTLGGMRGVRGEARKSVHELLNRASGDAYQMERSLIDIFKAEPLSGAAWLDFAKLQAKLDRPKGKMRLALEMSEFTEPHEVDVIVKRVEFCILTWEKLSKEQQQRTVSELIYMASFIDGHSIQLIKSVLERKDNESRRAIEDLIILQDRKKVLNDVVTGDFKLPGFKLR